MTVVALVNVITCKYTFIGNDHPTLIQLINVIPHIIVFWYDIGVELLGVDGVAELKAIRRNYHRDFQMCARKMFETWLERRPDANWNQLIQALSKPSINLSSVASIIEKMLLKEDVTFKGTAS